MSSQRTANQATRNGNFENAWLNRSAMNEADESDAFQIDVDGFEGPLDLLLHLARDQKVDLLRISVLALVEQYLEFIAKAQQVRLELAADYLVMAAWLAYLKSRLLIPKVDDTDQTPAEELAAQLQFRLKRLEAMRNCSQRLMAGKMLGRDIFARGMPEAVILEKKVSHNASLYDLLSAYGSMRERDIQKQISVGQRTVWSLKEAREFIEKMLGFSTDDWSDLQTYLIQYGVPLKDRTSAIASCFAATLELVREGALEIRQDSYHSPIMIKAGALPIQSGMAGSADG